MALTIAINGKGVITDAESTTGWGKTGLISSPVQESDIVLQGSYCVSTKASSKAGALYYDIGSGNELDFSASGTEEDELVYIWVNCTTLGGLATAANGGLRVWLATDTSNYAEWYFMGSDTISRWKGGKGGFTCVAIDPTTAPTATTGTFNLASVRYFGIYIDMTSTAKSENLMIDTIAVGKGVKVTGTDTDGWDDMIDYCTAYDTRAWGMVQLDESEEFVLMQGRITVGSSSQTAVTSLTTEGRIFKFFCYEYRHSTGSWVPMVPADRYGLTVEDAASYTTTYQDGLLVGTSAGRQGSTFIGTDLVETKFDLYGGSNTGSVTKLYGCTLKGVNEITWGNDADHHCYSCVFAGCGQFDPVGAVKIRNCSFIGTVAFATQVVSAAIADDGGTRTDETTAANNATADDMTLVPATPAVNDAYYFGSDFQFGSFDLDVSTAGATFVVTWEYYNGTWAALSGVIDLSDNFRIAGRSRIPFTWPSDWAMTTINSATAFFVRARVTTGGGTQAKGRQAWMHPTSSGAAILWNSNIDIRDCLFIANTHDENAAQAVEHTATGTFNYYGLEFSGNDYDILNSTDWTVEDYYDDQSGSSQQLGTSLPAVGQSITGAGGVLARARFRMKKIGTPGGNIISKLYAHSGVFGTSSVPTGSPLATSESRPASVLTDAIQLVDFEFKDEYTLVNATKYVITVEYDDNDVVQVVYDDVSPGHGGNYSSFNGTVWTADSGRDLEFYVVTGAEVIVKNREESDASTSNEIGDQPGRTVIQNIANLKIMVKDESGAAIQNAQTGIFIDPDGPNEVQLMNEDTLATGIAEEDYVYEGDQAVTLRVRKSSTGSTRYRYHESPQTITSSGLTVAVTLEENPFT